MRNLLLVSGIALAVVVGVAALSYKVLTDARQAQAEIAADYRVQRDALLALDARFPAPPAGPLDAARFAKWLAVRRPVAELFRARLAEENSGAIHRMQTENRLLERLAQSLVEKEMGLAEFEAIGARWRAVLAREEFADLQRAWSETVYTRDYPPPPRGRGVPLPAAAQDATEAERALVRERAEDLRSTMLADLLKPLIDRVRSER
jgi:hypothetical protein